MCNDFALCRCQVWHELSRGQIFQVKAFHPHQHAALKDGVAMHDENHVRMLSEEMSAVKEALCNTRAWMYFWMTNEVEPILAETKPVDMREISLGMPYLKPKCPRISNLIKVPTHAPVRLVHASLLLTGLVTCCSHFISRKIAMLTAA